MVSLCRRRSSSLMISPWKSGFLNPSTTSWTGPIAMSASLRLSSTRRRSSRRPARDTSSARDDEPTAPAADAGGHTQEKAGEMSDTKNMAAGAPTQAGYVAPEHRRRTGWAGMVVFAGVMLIMLGG